MNATPKVTNSFATKRTASNLQCFRLPNGSLKPLHTLPNSSSMFDQGQNFTDETRAGAF
jgi:hypothetical protein